MNWVCPLCGYENDDGAGTCMCGYQRDSSADLTGDTDELLNERQSEGGASHILDRTRTRIQGNEKKIKMKVPDKPVTKPAKSVNKQEKPSEEILVKEVDGWEFTFSQSETCLYLGTPALQSFRLRLTLDDVKEILDIMYEQAGIEKTTRKLQIPEEEVLDIVSVLDGMIEEKRSKVKISYSSEEISALADLINKKLKE